MIFFNAGLDTLELVKMSQKAENEFVGMNCGIMDQFAVGFGKKDHAIFLNCDTLSFENVPVILNDMFSDNYKYQQKKRTDRFKV